MSGPGGVSFINYADSMLISNLQKLSGTGTVSLDGGSTLDQLQSRQLADAMRISIKTRTANQPTLFSFDIGHVSAPNEFGATAQAFRNVGLFGLFGMVAVLAEVGGSAYPQTLFNGMTVQLKGYTTSAPDASAEFTAAAIPVGEISQQSANLQTTMSNRVFAQTPAGVITVLDSGSPEFYGQGWGGPTAGNKPLSFRVEISVAGTTAGGDCYFDIGRLWIGNAFRPKCGVANVAHAIVDSSQLQLSRDNQAYSQYFNRMRQMGFVIPAMTEMEAIGIGLSPRTADGDTDTDYYRADNYEQMMYALGVTKECVVWTQDYRASNTAIDSLALMKHSVYGHVTQWQTLTALAARKNPIDTRTGGYKRRLWSGGLTVQEER